MGALGNEGAVTIRGDRDVPVLRIETFEVVEAVDIFLDLAIESREVILSLGVLNADVESSFGLDSDAFEREEVERTGEGGGRSVCCVVDGVCSVSSNRRCMRSSWCHRRCRLCTVTIFLSCTLNTLAVSLVSFSDTSPSCRR